MSRAKHDGRAQGTGAVLGRLLSYTRPHRGLVALTAASALVSVSLSLTVPILVGVAIDAIVGPGQVDWVYLGRTVALIAGVVALVSATQWLQGYASNRLSYETVRDLRDDAYAKLSTVPLSYLDEQPAGDVISRIVNDADAVGDGLLQGVQQLFGGVVTIVGTLAFMFALSPAVALVVVLATPLSVLAAWLIARLNTKGFAEQQRLQGELAAYTQEMVAEQRLVTAFDHNGASMEGFKAINDVLNRVGEKAQFGGSLTNPGTRLANNVIYAIVVVTGCWCVVTGFPAALTIGGVQSFLSYATQYTKPFNEVSGVLAQIQTAVASARRIFALIDAPDERPDATDAAELPAEPRGEMAFEDVVFGYDPARPILDGISWHAAPGERIALVGPTGCGKTTLINLLLRFYDPQGGRIFVDGHDIEGLTRKSLRGAFGMVLQETWLFEGTVHDNIAYARPEATREEVVRAAEKAFADGFIRQLPQGYNTVIGEGGGALSQGQRQLLCIARVMLQDPSILLLDEATSSIDTRTEALVQEAFDAMTAGRTSLIVAHRLSTIRNATRILVLKDGHVAERGNHEELLAKGGFYAELYESQFANEEAEELDTAL